VVKVSEQKGHRVFESSKRPKKEQKLKDKNEKLKKIIAELTIDLKNRNRIVRIRRRIPMKRKNKIKSFLNRYS